MTKIENSAPEVTVEVAKIAVPTEAVDKVRGSLAPNAVGSASVDFYAAALREAGRDPESLSFAETVEVTRRLYAASADYRRGVAEVVAAEKLAIAEKARKDREAKKIAKLAADREKLIAKAKALGIEI